MTTTTPLGLPKPEITDPLANGWDAIADLADAIDARMGHARNLLVYSANASFTATDLAGAAAVRVRCRGGGGAGGGAGTTGASQNSAGSGGGQGAYAESILLASALALPVAITVPAAAVGVTNGTGGTGGDCSFGTYVVAKGGAGGQTSTAFGGGGYTNAGGAGGSSGSSVGQLVLDGLPGDPGLTISTIVALPGRGGGNSLLTNFNTTPNTAVVRGAGGQGASNLASQATARAGGTAAIGFVVVELIF